MEAKVDIRKLQLLNDRINQTIDALHQVRLTVHGISHSQGSQNIGQVPYTQNLGQGFNGQNPWHLQSNMGYGFANAPWGYNPFAGIQHTAMMQQPFMANQAPWLNQHIGQQGYSAQPGVFGSQFPWQNQISGISHSSPETTDVVRFAHTFPYAFSPYTPFVSMF